MHDARTPIAYFVVPIANYTASHLARHLHMQHVTPALLSLVGCDAPVNSTHYLTTFVLGLAVARMKNC
jgi:hypothetical protein